MTGSAVKNAGRGFSISSSEISCHVRRLTLTTNKRLLQRNPSERRRPSRDPPLPRCTLLLGDRGAPVKPAYIYMQNHASVQTVVGSSGVPQGSEPSPRVLFAPLSTKLVLFSVIELILYRNAIFNQTLFKCFCIVNVIS